MRVKQGVELAIKPINMHGGGYSNFLDKIKQEPQNNCLAKFIIIDYDKCKKDRGERTKLAELIEYCKLKNNRGNIPHFLIINNPDFEYIACMHLKKYKNQNVAHFIKKTLGFTDIEKFKSKKDIYEYLNSGDNSYLVMISKISDKNKIIKNIYTINKSRFKINIQKTLVKWENSHNRGSNINEFFEILDW